MKADKQDEYDRGLMYAEACFETFRVLDGQIFHWPVHEKRLAAGLEAFGLELPEGLHARCLDAAAGCASDALLWLTITGGDAPWGLVSPVHASPNIYIQAVPYAEPEGEVRLRAVTWPMPLAPRPAKFTGDYAATLRGLRMLRDELPSGEAALVCDARHICAATTANVLLYRQERWRTPAHAGALPGVVRGALLDAGVVHEMDCPRIWLDDCEAIALTNSSGFVRPVASINGRRLVTDTPHFAPLWRVVAGEAGVPEGGMSC